MSEENTIHIFLKCTWQLLFFKPVVQTKRLHLKLEMGFTATKTSVTLFRHQNKKKGQESDKTPGDWFFRSHTYSTVLLLSLLPKLRPKKYI